MRNRHRWSQLKWTWSNHVNSRRLVGPRVLLHQRSLVRRWCHCQSGLSIHEVRMETAEPSSSTRPLEGGDESSSKRVRSLAGMLLFDEE